MRPSTTLGTISILSIVLMLTGRASAELPTPDEKLAIGDDAKLREDAINSLRSLGPEGLYRLIAMNRDILSAGPSDPNFAKLNQAIDTVAMQKDARFSNLYWYTNLDEAKAAAAKSGKPILSLRMLGYLNEEYSCANSRYFRTALYANEDISKFLRGNFVLHWQSVRPVPRITIDMGDGRKIEQTITGNSIHYILAPDGRVIDALPGLYGPQAFLRTLQSANGLAISLAMFGQLDLDSSDKIIREYQNRSAIDLMDSWAADLKRSGKTTDFASLIAAAKAKQELVAVDAKNANPDANRAGRIAASKVVAERPLVRAVLPPSFTSIVEANTNENDWNSLVHPSEAVLDKNSRRMMAEKSGLALDGPQMFRMVAKFQSSMAVDTVRNNYMLRLAIFDWLKNAKASPSLDALNDRVYTELFLTPRRDPWLGLKPADVYTGLPIDSQDPVAAK